MGLGLGSSWKGCQLRSLRDLAGGEVLRPTPSTVPGARRSTTRCHTPHGEESVPRGQAGGLSLPARRSPPRPPASCGGRGRHVVVGLRRRRRKAQRP